MNKERDNESLAKRIVEANLGVELVHADINGGVDYLSRDADLALEVTAVTDGSKRGARDALRRSEAKGATTSLQGCWIVFTSDTQEGMKTFVQRVQPAIAELECAGEDFFDEQRAALHVMNAGPLAHLYRPLLDAGVERAVHAPHAVRSDDPNHEHRVWVSSGSGGSVSGSDESLENLIQELEKKFDNPTKLKASGAKQRHLFVWVNDDTWFNIARPLSHESPGWAEQGWGIPSVAPRLDPAITHLWVMHERSRMGWYWDGDEWRSIRGDP